VLGGDFRPPGRNGRGKRPPEPGQPHSGTRTRDRVKAGAAIAMTAAPAGEDRYFETQRNCKHCYSFLESEFYYSIAMTAAPAVIAAARAVTLYARSESLPSPRWVRSTWRMRAPRTPRAP
jgi:hypothetical protein